MQDLVVVSKEPLQKLRNADVAEQQLFTFGLVESHRRPPKQLKSTCVMVCVAVLLYGLCRLLCAKNSEFSGDECMLNIYCR